MRIHVYSPRGHWVAGGEVAPGLDAAEALRRIRRAVGPSEAEVAVGGRPASPLPPDDGRDLPDLAVFAVDARDVHLQGALVAPVAAGSPWPRGPRDAWTPEQIADDHARWRWVGRQK